MTKNIDNINLKQILKSFNPLFLKVAPVKSVFLPYLVTSHVKTTGKIKCNPRYPIADIIPHKNVVKSRVNNIESNPLHIFSIHPTNRPSSSTIMKWPNFARKGMIYIIKATTAPQTTAIMRIYTNKLFFWFHKWGLRNLFQLK